MVTLLAILRGYGVVNELSALRGYVTHHHSSIIADIDVDAARTHTNHLVLIQDI